MIRMPASECSTSLSRRRVPIKALLIDAWNGQRNLFGNRGKIDASSLSICAHGRDFSHPPSFCSFGEEVNVWNAPRLNMISHNYWEREPPQKRRLYPKRIILFHFYSFSLFAVGFACSAFSLLASTEGFQQCFFWRSGIDLRNPWRKKVIS